MAGFVGKDDEDWQDCNCFDLFDLNSASFFSDEMTSLTTTPVMELETNAKREKKENNKMSDRDWNRAINNSIAIIERRNGQPILSRDITEDDFGLEPNQIRYTIKKAALKSCSIFPWFHSTKTDGRFRQSLAKEIRQGTTIQTILVAMNYFFQLPFTQNEIELLRQLYLKMTIPISSHCLTTIVEVYTLFREQQSEQQSALMIGGGTTTITSPLPPHDNSSRGNDEESFMRKKPRTNEWAIQKNFELIAFYREADADLFKDLIENLYKANAELRADGLRLAETYQTTQT
jgi:hypothetical protein